MSRLGQLLFLLALGHSIARAEPKKTDTLAGPLLLAEADRLLMEVFSTTDDQPPPNTLSTKFGNAQQAYLRACKRGEARGCWSSMWMAAGTGRNFDLEIKQLLALCRRGQVMACRALQAVPTGKTVLTPRDLGYAGSYAGCKFNRRCDERRLHLECAKGFARSCRESADEQLHPRGDQLAQDGCAQGLFTDCRENDPAQAFRKCTLVPRACLSILPKVLPGPSRENLAERACKIGGRPMCVLLAGHYALGLVPQSIPGRARYLARRFCTPAQIANTKDDCFNLEGLGAKLARLP